MRSSDPVADYNRYDRECQKVAREIRQMQEATDYTIEDYATAIQDGDPYELWEVAMNNPNDIGSEQWVKDVIKQARIDEKVLQEYANWLKDDRIARTGKAK